MTTPRPRSARSSAGACSVTSTQTSWSWSPPTARAIREHTTGQTPPTDPTAKEDPMTMTPEQASGFHDTFGRLVSGVEQVLLGKTFVVRLGFIALFSEGHLLLEDFPGTGKTSLARA